MKTHKLLDIEKQKKARKYEREKRIFEMLGFTITTLFLLLFYFTGISEKIAYLKISSHIFPVLTVYIFIFFILQGVVNFPFLFISTYRIEHKYGFSRQNLREWFIDYMKSIFILMVLGLIVIWILLLIMYILPGIWWLLAGVIIALFSVVFTTLFPVIIMPLFHKYDIIEDNDLKISLNKIMDKSDIIIEGFYKEDTSEKTSKENAMLAGMGKTKRVILADNIVENMNTEEIKSILAHEVGHYKRKHMIKLVSIGLIFQIIAFFILNITVKSLFSDFLTGFRENLTLLPIIFLFLELINFILIRVPRKWISRFFEREADKTAIMLTENPGAFMSAMAGIADRNLSNAYPPEWIKIIYYDHPPIGERLEFAENFSK